MAEVRFGLVMCGEARLGNLQTLNQARSGETRYGLVWSG